MSFWSERAKAVKSLLDLGRLAVEAGITAEEKPASLPDRPGFKWEPMLNTESKTIGWQEVEDPGAEGTSDNPIAWEPGMTVQTNYFYTSNGTRYVCVQSGAPAEITTEYFEAF